MIRRIVATFYVFVTRDIAIGLINNFVLINIPHTDLITPSSALMLLGNITFLLTALAYSRFRHVKKETIYSPAFWVFALFIAIAIMIVGVLATYGFPQFTLYYSMVIMFAVSHFAVFYLSNAISRLNEYNLKAILHSKEKEYYFAQCQLMQESVAQVKSIRHDMKMHLATASDYIANKKEDEAAVYINGLIGNIGASEVYSDTGNIAFDSIVNFKLKNAIEDNIKLDINILTPPVLNVEAVDIVTIIGNLLDNALDAVAKVDNKVIKLNIEHIKGNLFVKVENTFDGEVKYNPEKNGAEKMPATRKEGTEHGHGLANIRKSVEKYDGDMDIAHVGDVFSVSVLLYLS
jgi:sensor histidine kinase YesM